ncbi:MAG: hypothetical protein EHM64_14270 [Ignavibacteriae bacterium]|nr:MAG: hypothetical protein EHM64_14270 [Ignavibacteriota bacterium]
MKGIQISKVDWKWVGIGYCFFVVFHLLPTFILNGLSLHMDMLPLGVELFVGLAIVAFYIGYRSRGVTILEPVISVLLYDITLLFEFRNLWGRSASGSVWIILLWGFLTLVMAVCSAWLGELFQARMRAKA